MALVWDRGSFLDWMWTEDLQHDPSMGQHPMVSIWMPAFSSGPEGSERWKVLVMTAPGNGQK